jgi:uncharacterized protein (DUF952 family)/heme-degrading monooxygenase HmoA
VDTHVAVIFTSRRTGDDEAGYAEMADRMDALAAEQPGYVGIDTVRAESGDGITVSYWVDDAAARAWKEHAEHLVAQRLGRQRWYDRYTIRVATVERGYEFVRPIYHLALPDDWAEAQGTGTYTASTRGVTVADEGFVHCSFAHQIEGVAARFYADLDELCVLHLDRASIEADLRVEAPADGIDERFPHVYRPIAVTDVTDVTAWRRDGDQWGAPPVAV